MDRQRCVIYLRVSTAVQVDGFSLSAQRETLISYARRNDMEIVEEYEDAGKSGKSIEGRPAFQKMMRDIENGLQIDCVLVFKLSRFGRSAVDVLTSVEFLKDYGVSLIAVNDGINSGTASGILIISVLSAVAEIERENIQEQTMSGRREKARQGKWNGGPPPYGYDLKDGILVVNEEEAKVVKQIFEMYVTSNRPVSEIAEYFNMHYGRIDKVTHEHTFWSVSGIKYLIDNEVYIGLMPYGKKQREKVKGTKNQYRRVLKKEYLKEKGMHEAIVTPELFEKAKARRLTNRQRVASGRRPFLLLSDLAICPFCFKPLVSYKRKYKDSEGEEYSVIYYACNNSLHPYLYRSHKCTYNAKIPSDALEQAVLEIIDRLAKLDSLKEIIEKELSSSDSLEELRLENEKYDAKYKDLNKKKNLLLSQIDDLSTDDAMYLVKSQDLNNRLEGFYKEMEKIVQLMSENDERISKINASEINKDNILGILRGSGSIIKDLGRKDQKDLLHRIISSIEFKDEFVNGVNPIRRITFKFPVFKNQESSNEINWDKDNLPYIYEKVDGRKDISISVDVDDILGSIEFQKKEYEHYKPKRKNRPTRPDSDESLVNYIEQNYGFKTCRKAVMNVRHQLQGKEVKGYLPKGQRYEQIKETLIQFKRV